MVCFMDRMVCLTDKRFYLTDSRFYLTDRKLYLTDRKLYLTDSHFYLTTPQKAAPRRVAVQLQLVFLLVSALFACKNHSNLEFPSNLHAGIAFHPLPQVGLLNLAGELQQ